MRVPTGTKSGLWSVSIVFGAENPCFEITPTPEEIKKYSSATAAAAQIASDVIRTALAVRIAGDEFSKENIAMALFGGTGTIAQTGTSVTAEIVPVVLLDRFYKLEFRDISAVSVTGPSSTPTYDLVDDYLVDAVTGRLYIVPTGDIPEDGDIEVDYTYATIALDTVLGMTAGSIKGAIRFIGDPARGPVYEVEIWRASVRSDGAIGFISDEYAQWTLSGDIESDAPNHPTEPHYRMIRIS